MSLYLTSTDPDVIAVVERNRVGLVAFKEGGLAWAAERGADSFYPHSFGGEWSVFALPIKPEGFGQWTKPDHHGRSKPFANNTAEQQVLRSLSFKAEPVPGIPGALHSVSDHDGRSYLMWPTPFVQDGAAWLSYAHRPASEELAKIGPQWQECLASAWHAALERHQSDAEVTP